MMENYSVKWDQYQKSILNSFQKLRSQDIFKDVTLVSDDYQRISAHKMILSACSGYFNKVLSNVTHSHPMLCLSGINSTELQLVLDYIYSGEVQVPQPNLDRFLTIAQILQLDGLQKDKHIFDEQIPIDAVNFLPPPPSSASLEFKPDKVVEPPNLVPKQPKIKTETGNFTPAPTPAEFQYPTVQKSIKVSEKFETIEQLDKKIEECYERKAYNHFLCLICGHISKVSSHVKQHIETHFEGLSFPCEYCERVLNTRHNLRSHTRRHHVPTAPMSATLPLESMNATF